MRAEQIRTILREEVLSTVSKPARYLGHEVNSVHKNWEQATVKVALAFPDIYEVGMSHLGLKILYHLLNEEPDFLAERAYAPWPDMEEVLRGRSIPLFSLESSTPLNQFDLVGFTLQYELSYPTILNMLDLAGIPLQAEERGGTDPLIIAGGPCAFNPEPLAPFFDLMVIGEAEEIFPQLLRKYQEYRQKHEPDRLGLLQHLATLPGIYVPRFYQPLYNSDGTLQSWTTKGEVAFPVRKQVLRSLEGVTYPTKFIVPYLEAVHDRGTLEVFRGCVRGCRFCQAGMIYRPVRERSVTELQDLALAIIEATGYDELSLVSLSTGDYSGLADLVEALLPELQERRVALSLPSLRIDTFAVELAEKIQTIRKTGLTFAPEAGTQRLRDVINKNVTEEDLLRTVEAAFTAGWYNLKLYFMIGLPTETTEDLQGIYELAQKVADLGNLIKRQAGISKRINVTVSVSSFVPKAHTPFQWVAQNTREELQEKQRFLESLFRGARNLSLKYHEVETSFIEGVLARGDRQIATAIQAAWQRGAKLEGWSEFFSPERWSEAFQAAGIDPAFYANRTRHFTEVLPWDVIDSGIDKAYLLEEYRQALRGQPTADCRSGCTDCGVCPNLKVANRLVYR